MIFFLKFYEICINFPDLESMSVTSARPVLPDETSPEVAVQAYDNYNFDHTYNEELPITKHKDQVNEQDYSN